MIILNMIVKNEGEIIERCLNSVVDFIDAVVICDTGSTDNTVAVIEKWKVDNNIEGIVLSQPFVNFEVSRNNSLQACKKWIEENSTEGDNNYICIIDADDYLVIEDMDAFENSLDSSDANVLLIDAKAENIVYKRSFIVRANVSSKWIGAVHEYLSCEGSREVLNGGFLYINRDGDRNKDPVKYLNDAVVLEKELKKENNSRNLFYLAQSYRDYGFYKMAEEKYLKRFEINESPEERYISLLEAAKCRMTRLNETDDKCLQLLYKAFCFRPQRLEAPYYLVQYFRKNNLHFMGYALGRSLANIPYPTDVLFVDKDIHQWKFLDEVAVCACWAQDKALFRTLYEKILTMDIPEESRERISRDLKAFS